MENFMSIIKLEVNLSEAVSAIKRFKENRLRALEEFTKEFKRTAAEAINGLLNAEMAMYLGSPEQKDNKRNGYKSKNYTFKGIGTVSLKIPQARKGGFESNIIPKSERLDPRLKEDIAVLNLAGISTRTMAMMSRRILGVDISNETVAKSLDIVSDKALEWLRRPITDKYWALYVDGTNFNIQRRGSTEKEPSLVVLGIDENDYRSVLAIEPGYKDSAEAWRTVFKELKKRGLDPFAVKIGIMDGLTNLEKVFAEEFPRAKTARCWVHALKNALNKTPAKLREAFKTFAHKIMYASSKDGARSAFNDLKTAMSTDAKRAINCLEKDLESLLTHYEFDRSYWRVLRTTNPIERINNEFKRRIKPMRTLGESTLEIILVFTALKLEMGWKRKKVNSKNWENLSGQKKENKLEEAVVRLLQ
ncbi:MAG: IS256 family transposase [Bacteroidota bacterium]